MLVVISIIALLVGLLFPAVRSALSKAETGKAKATVLSIAAAFKAYDREYSGWPSGATVSSQPVTTNLFGNPRGIVFLDTATKDISDSSYVSSYGSGAGYILDPWKNPYQVAFDVTYQNGPVATNCSGATSTITSGIAVWSLGPDGVCGTSDDITSW